MEYEIVELKQKTVAGIAARTRNDDPEAGAIIGGLWQRFYQENIYASIPGKVNDKAMALYTEYESDAQGAYTTVVACEVNDAVEQKDLKVCTIPAGRYARFIVRGDMVQAVMDAWRAIWSMDLPRSFVCDFEEYQNSSMDDAEVHIYISLKDEKG